MKQPTKLYEADWNLYCIGIGGDPIVGTDYMYWLNQFEADSETMR
jgi:succinyl-CoA synthetase alpha subunit